MRPHVLLFAGGTLIMSLSLVGHATAQPSTQQEALGLWSSAFYGVALYDVIKCKTTGFNPSSLQLIRDSEKRLRESAGSLVTRAEEDAIRKRAETDSSLRKAGRDGEATMEKGANCTAASKGYEKTAVQIIEAQAKQGASVAGATAPTPAPISPPSPPTSAPVLAQPPSPPVNAAAPTAQDPNPLKALGQALQQALQPPPAQNNPAPPSATPPQARAAQTPPSGKVADTKTEADSSCAPHLDANGKPNGIVLKETTWARYHGQGANGWDALTPRSMPSSGREIAVTGSTLPWVVGGDARDCLELVKRLDDHLAVKNAAAERAKVQAEANAQTEAKRQAEVKAKAAKDPNSWENYQTRKRNILEKVFNYSTLGDENGREGGFWVSGLDDSKKCVLTLNGTADGRTIDLRKVNERGFRIKKEFVLYPNQQSELARMNGGGYWMWQFGDEKINFRASDRGQVMERLQTAWALAFRECPGVKTEF